MAKGPWRRVHERRFMRIRLGAGKRESVVLSGCRNDEEADERAAAIADVAQALLKAGRGDKVKQIGDAMGMATTAREIEIARKAAARVIEEGAAASSATSFAQFASKWTTGELHRLYRDHVKDIDHRRNEGILTKHVNPLIGDVPMSKFTLEDAELVMAKLPTALGTATRRHVAQVLHRISMIAHYPAKLLKSQPLPRGFLPKLGKPKAKPYLYPDEVSKLLANTLIPLERRLAYGILSAEGMRASELLGRKGGKKIEALPPLAWRQLDLAKGTIVLDRNKTVPRTWVLDQGTTLALRRWKQILSTTTQRSVVGDAPVVIECPGQLGRLAEHLRADLHLSGVKRPELFERSTLRTWLRAHHLRSTFVTLSLANGRTETWVADRTGHTSSEMINRYRSAARTATELGLGFLTPLDRALPELRPTRGTRVATVASLPPKSGGGAKVGQKAKGRTPKAKEEIDALDS